MRKKVNQEGKTIWRYDKQIFGRSDADENTSKPLDGPRPKVEDAISSSTGLGIPLLL